MGSCAFITSKGWSDLNLPTDRFYTEGKNAEGRLQDSFRKPIAACAVMAGDLDRLTCFDRLAKEAGLNGPQPLPTGTSNTGKWQIKRDKNPLDDSERVTLSLISDSGRGRYGAPVVLVARCQSNETDVYVNWGTYVGDDSHDVYHDWKFVTIRVGSQESEQQRWSISTSKDATFAPDWPGNLLKEMSNSDRFIAQLTPYGDSPITAIFNTAGLANAMRPLEQACKWPDDFHTQVNTANE